MAGNGYDNGQGAADPRQGWSAAPGGGHGPSGEPEYFTANGGAPGGAPDGPYGGPHGGPYGAPQGDPYGADQPGSTRAFTVGDGYEGYEGYDAAAEAAAPVQDNVTVYRAGGQSTPRATGPRLPWKALLTGIYREPARTFDLTRDHQVWLPALVVSLLYGALAVLGIGLTQSEVVNSTFATAVWSILGAAVVFTLAGAMLGAVTYGLARQFGGDGPWQSTIGLAVLIGWMTDAPRLLLALFLPAGNTVVQALGWATWLFCAVLLTMMVKRVHDLPWGKAAGAAAVQLLALLVLIKLPTLG
ncbi:Yip1 family protein [Kitasatospora sp. McL0602]|uniref:Yip1 family protein n=1 Tax=Kitasatospora sp. McL0602 TaxID=3439530 RepID=UPI003F8CA02F